MVVNGRVIGYNQSLHPYANIMQINLYPWAKPGASNRIELWPRTPEETATARMIVKSVRIGTVEDFRFLILIFQIFGLNSRRTPMHVHAETDESVMRLWLFCNSFPACLPGTARWLRGVRVARGNPHRERRVRGLAAIGSPGGPARVGDQYPLVAGQHGSGGLASHAGAAQAPGADGDHRDGRNDQAWRDPLGADRKPGSPRHYAGAVFHGAICRPARRPAQHPSGPALCGSLVAQRGKRRIGRRRSDLDDGRHSPPKTARPTARMRREQSPHPVGTFDWQPRQLVFITDPYARWAGFTFQLRWATGTVWYDDVELVDLGPVVHVETY